VRVLFGVLFMLSNIILSTHSADFTHCLTYYKNATAFINNTPIYSISYNNKSYLVAFSKTSLNSPRIIKTDPFLGLYLFEGKTLLSYTLKPLDNFSKTRPIAALNGEQYVRGEILNTEKGIFDRGIFSKPLPKHSVISNICYQIYGITAESNTFIPKKLIERFLSSKGSIYGDIGVRVSPSLVVEQIDPFFNNNPFLPNDKILAINNVSLNNIADFEWIVANVNVGSQTKVQVIREGKKLTFNINVDKRYGGGLIQDTFLGRYGVMLDKNLKIISMSKQLPFVLSQLSVGDQIIWIDKTPIKTDDNFQHFRSLLSKAKLKGNIELLILHMGVEVFIRSKL